MESPAEVAEVKSVCSACKQSTNTHTKTIEGEQKSICRACFIAYLKTVPRRPRQNRQKSKEEDNKEQKPKNRKSGLALAVMRLEGEVKSLRSDLQALKQTLKV